MKYGVFYATLVDCARAEGLSEHEVLTRAKDGGVDYLECSWNQIRGKDAEFFALLERLGLGLSLYLICTPDGVLTSAADVLVTDELERIAGLGVHDLMLVVMLREQGGMPAPRGADEPDPKGEEVFAKTVEAVTIIVEAARLHGISVTFEDFDSARLPCGSCAEIVRYLGAIPGLGVTFDTGNFQFHGENVADCFAPLADRITHVHVKDRVSYAPDAPTAECGKGALPIADILASLRDRGYDRMITAELFGVKPELSIVLESVNFIRSQF